MRASISTWRTAMSSLAISCCTCSSLRGDVGDEQLVGARLGDHAAARATGCARHPVPAVSCAAMSAALV